MSSLSLLLTLCLLLTTSFSQSRKELRNKDENVLRNSVYYSNRINPSRVVQISWQPRLFLYKGFLSHKECDYLISLAHSVKDSHQDDIVKMIEERLSVWTFLPKENSKPLQIMQYGIGKDTQNMDYFTNKTDLVLTGPLMATIVLYLSDSTQGGQIIFPESVTKSSSWSNCGNTSDILQPVKGNALLFFSLNLNTSPDRTSFHARCPVLKGDMWSAVKFFYARSVKGGEISTASDVDECTDEDDNCPAWAATGECQGNPVFMVGSPDYYGTCRKSCNAC
ncbi:unnamed protein product [Vicia faba]|uniref:procollagen-proline 4-dioxygenase n=1 Tax=Vicia faba TaxID=3906 RepID=A0AAV0Z5A7_VICFA|nr:unnamed protein product [Vicia faba]